MEDGRSIAYSSRKDWMNDNTWSPRMFKWTRWFMLIVSSYSGLSHCAINTPQTIRESPPFLIAASTYCHLYASFSRWCTRNVSIICEKNKFGIIRTTLCASNQLVSTFGVLLVHCRRETLSAAVSYCHLRDALLQMFIECSYLRNVRSDTGRDGR